VTQPLRLRRFTRGCKGVEKGGDCFGMSLAVPCVGEEPRCLAEEPGGVVVPKQPSVYPTQAVHGPRLHRQFADIAADDRAGSQVGDGMVWLHQLSTEFAQCEQYESLTYPVRDASDNDKGLSEQQSSIGLLSPCALDLA
jgi:hypothetical protein